MKILKTTDEAVPLKLALGLITNSVAIYDLDLAPLKVIALKSPSEEII
jgi:hypothetical protein